jgi:hypothetical protein
MVSTGVTWTDFTSLKRPGCPVGGTGCAEIGGNWPVGGGGSVGDRRGVGAAHPAKNTIVNNTPINFCVDFGFFISCSFLYY